MAIKYVSKIHLLVQPFGFAGNYRGLWFFKNKITSALRRDHTSGLNNKVDVVFDKWAIPHIEAENELDAYLALGYLHAQDRIFQMELMIRVAQGRLSEMLGEGHN